MRRQLKDKKILVTGASSGIGYQLSLQLAQRGAHVLGTARRIERLHELRQEWAAHPTGEPSGSIEVLAADITAAADRAAIVAWIDKEWGPLDGLVNNAGAGAIGPFADADPDRLRRVMEVDFFAPVELTRLLLPHLMIGQQPFIAIVGSVLSHQAVPNKSEYCAAKFAIRGWSESLRSELRPSKVDVIMISPSTTRSEFFRSLIGTNDLHQSRSIGSMSPSKVAAHSIRAIERNKREIVLSMGGKALVLSSRFMPGWLDRFL